MKIIACMSGTSLDGLDIALCQFSTQSSLYQFEVLYCKTYPYDEDLKQRLSEAHSASALEYVRLEKYLSDDFADKIQHFIDLYQIKDVDYIASHGHTVFHQPENGFTYQIGKGLQMAQRLGIPVIYDFRSADVFNGGQGAPLVPIGDALLFPDYDYCLNIGGFSNVSYQLDNERIAFDVSPANIVLNALSEKLGAPYDKDGAWAKRGQIIADLLEQLNKLDYYTQTPPKSLGKEWVEHYVLPLISPFDNYYDVLRTFTEHIAIQLGRVLNTPNSKTLVTGGGAYNHFLIERIKTHSRSEIIIPDATIVEFKEAIIFGFLGYLKVNKKINILSSVTGACKDSSAGLIAYP